MPLIRFSLENYHSFKTRHTLDLMPHNYKNKPIDGKIPPLNISGIFGGNASGKSNIVSAITCLRKIVTDPDYISKQTIHHWTSGDLCTIFEIIVQVGHTTYDYSLKTFAFGICTDKIQSREYKFVPVHETLYYRIDNIDDADWKTAIDHQYEVSDLIEMQLREEQCYSETLRLKSELSKIDVKQEQVANYIKKAERELKRSQNKKFSIVDSNPSQIELQIEQYSNQLNKLSDEKQATVDTLFEIQRELKLYSAKIIEVAKNQKIYCCDLLTLDPADIFLRNVNKNRAKQMLSELHSWFCSSLFIIGTGDFYYPLNNPKTITNLSSVLSSLDVGINRIDWEKTEFTLKKIKKSIDSNDYVKLERLKNASILDSTYTVTLVNSTKGLLKIECWSGEEEIHQMVVYHEDSPEIGQDILSESDGTRRIVDLASILIPSKHDLTFLVDEIDRRMHPLLTLHLIKLFRQYNDEDKQLIFTSHELELMTERLFDRDEIWLVDRIQGESTLISFEDTKMKFGIDMKEVYLNDSIIGGKPHFNRRVE